MKFHRFGLMTRVGACAAAMAILAACGSSTPTPQPPPVVTMAPIKHVFTIILENQTYNNTFGATLPVPYLSQTVVAQGALLQQYYGTSHFSLGNYVSLLSGQAVTQENQDDCAPNATYPALSTNYASIVSQGLAAYNQVTGHGCVYPASTLTIADQLTAAGLTWKGYMEDMGNDSTREASTCGQPIGGVGAPDNTQSAQVPPNYKNGGTQPVSDQYAARHNPFVYFHSLIDTGACSTNVVPLNSSTLPVDLASVSTTPNYVFITPNLCDDGHDVPCHTPGSPTGVNAYTPENTFLKKWVPIIVHSPAFQKDGLLIITFDETSLTGTSASGVAVGYDGSGCCSEPSGPNTMTPGIPPLAGPAYYNIPITMGANGISGGGQTGTVLLSTFIKPGTVSTVPYNHYYMLKSIEDYFGLANLGYAGFPGTTDFGADVFGTTINRYSVNL